ncbi:MAG: hypothetical protein AAGA85_03380 [Bacteroidota bacterium]|jgi:hypothetical protein
MINFFKSNSKDKLKIKFNKDWNSFIVVRNNSNILYTGSKEQCEIYLKNHAA